MQTTSIVQLNATKPYAFTQLFLPGAYDEPSFARCPNKNWKWAVVYSDVSLTHHMQLLWDCQDHSVMKMKIYIIKGRVYVYL